MKMKIYTGKGDLGETSIIGGRMSKSSAKVEAYGTVDEANSVIGLSIASLPEEEQELREELENIQHILFDCGSDLSMKAGLEGRKAFKVSAEVIPPLEARIDAYVAEAPDLERFILPGGSRASAHLHVARTVVRRAERRVVELAKEEKINPYVLQYLNRLSDYLFALARVMNDRLGVADVEYERSAKVFHDIKNEDD